MMFTLCLTVVFAAAPIPKVSTYEGSIAFLIQKPELGVLVLSPTGEELKRFALKELKGNPYAIRMSRNQTAVCIETIESQAQAQGKNNQFVSRIYLVDLSEKTKPKVIVEKKDRFTWALHRDATFVYGSEVDPDVKAKPNMPSSFRHWQYELKTETLQKLDLPANVSIVDISHDDESLCTNFFATEPNERTRTAIYSIKTGKRTFLSDDPFSPLTVSPDGKLIFIQDFSADPMGNRLASQYASFDVKTKTKTAMEYPEGTNQYSAYSMGPKNRICVSAYSIRQNGGRLANQKIYVIPIDGSKSQLIYETKEGESLYDCDWR